MKHRILVIVLISVLAACNSGSASTAQVDSIAPELTPPTSPENTITATTSTVVEGSATTTTSSTTPGGGGWKMTFSATYAVENQRICNDSLGVDCPAEAEVHGTATFGSPAGAAELYVIDAGTATQTQTTTYNDGGHGCGTKTDSADLAVDVSVTRVGDDFLMWFGGGGYAAGPFIDTVFLGAGCEDGPQPAVFYFDKLVVPAAPGTYQVDVSDFAVSGSDDPFGRVTTIDFSPQDGGKRIHLTLTLEQV